MTYVDEDGDVIIDYSNENNDSTNIPSDDIQNVSPDTQETEIPQEENKEDDDFFKDVIKMLIQDKTDNESIEDDKENESEDSSESVPELVPDPTNDTVENDVSSGNAIDYSGLLGDIISRQDNIIENQEYIIAVSDDNKINSTLESQSATNVLLMIVIVILLVDLLVHFIRGLF